jgi:hypothetical protein
MDLERKEARSFRSAPLAQVALAALVAGSLLAFSALAFSTAFSDDVAPGALSATTPRVAAAAPVLLPASKTAISPTPPPTTEQVAADGTTADAIASTGVDPRGDVVLGTRVARTKAAARAAQVSDERRASHSAPPSVQQEDTHKRRVGKGHDKAHGKGHHTSKDSKSSRDVEAREEDDEWDDHGDDDDGRDDDDSNSSRSGGSSSGGSGSHGSGDDHSGSRG